MSGRVSDEKLRLRTAVPDDSDDFPIIGPSTYMVCLDLIDARAAHTTATAKAEHFEKAFTKAFHEAADAQDSLATEYARGMTDAAKILDQIMLKYGDFKIERFADDVAAAIRARIEEDEE